MMTFTDIHLKISSATLTISDYEKAKLIRKIVAELNHISEKNQFYLKSRKTKVVPYCFMRQSAIYLIKKNTHLTLKQIARLFANQDHATIIHSHKVAKELLDSHHPFISQLVENAERKYLQAINKK